MKMEDLPEECMALILSGTSPCDACRISAVSKMIRDAAESQILWDKFLPSDYIDILSRLVSPLSFTSKKDLFFKLSNRPLLIDGGTKTFYIEKYSNKRSYMLSAKKLSITWGTNRFYWCWKPSLDSRFSQVVELVMITWLDIQGKISTKILSPNAKYGAYLIIKFAKRAYGLEKMPSEVSAELGNYKSKGQTYLRKCSAERKEANDEESLFVLPKKDSTMEEEVLVEREDGWLEIELGEFYNDGSEEEVKMSLREVKGDHLKAGLIVEGIEVRPKL